MIRSPLILAASALGAALLAGACGGPPVYQEPVPQAVEVTIADSARYLLDAATQAITDEGLSIHAYDKKAGFVESEWTDVGSLHLLQDVSTVMAPQRLVKFEFWTRSTFGGTTLSGAVVYQPTPYGGRNSERMLPPDHPAREVLTRMMTNLRTHAEDAKRKREEKAHR